jgi:hypothetical protein
MSETFNYNTVYNTISATTLTGANLSVSNVSAANIVVSGNLSVAGTLTTVNLTTTNLIDTNISAGSANITNATIATAIITSNLVAIGNSNTLGSLFTTGGNVGLGTTSPLAKLNVQSDASNIYPGDYGQIIISGATDSRKRLGLMMDTTNNVGIIGAILNGVSTYNLCLGAGSAGAPSSVGINTTSPAQTLDVNGTARINNNLMFSSASNNNSGINLPTVGYGIHWGDGYSRIYDDGNLHICTDDTIHFYTGSTTSSPGTERITILQNGNIGMGITSPNLNLEVAGTMRIGNNAALNNKLLVLYDNNTGDAISNATNFLGFGINGGTLRYQVPSDQMHKFYCGGDMRMQIGTTNTIITSQTGVYETYWPSGWGGLATRDICGASIYASVVNQRSDVRKKQDIVDYTRGLSEVLQMRPVSFRWKDSLEYGTQYGFIAQEIETFVPEIVKEDGAGFKYLSNNFYPMYVNAIKELKGELDIILKEIAELTAS